MFRFLTICALTALAAAAPGFIEHQHHVLTAAPVVAKVGAIVHTVPAATSHQSFTQYHNKAVITPVVKHVVPVVKTVAPVVHQQTYVAPIVKTISTPVVHQQTYVAPIVKTISTPIVHQQTYVAPLVKTISTPVVHHQTYVSSVPVVKHISPVVKTYTHVPHAVSHQSHTQIHQKSTIYTPVVAPVLKTVAVAATPVAHVYHH